MGTIKNISDVTSLRQKAEEQLKNRHSETKKNFSEADLLKLIHELEVHQIELELQNEELLFTKEQEELAKAKYTSLFDFAPTAYFTVSESGMIEDLNLAGAQMLGKERVNLIHNKLALFIESNSRVIYEGFISRVFRSKSPVSCEVTLDIKKESNIYTLLTGALSDDGKHCLITAADITERKLFEDRVQKKQERFQALVDVSLAGIWTTDPFGNNTYVSRRWSQITGISADNAEGNGWSKGLHPDDRESVFHEWKQAAINDKPYLSDFRFIRPDGVEVWVLCEAVAVKDNDGKTIEWIGTITDITERKQADEKLHKSKQLLEDIINNAPVRIFWKDRNLIYQGCNIEFAEDAGYAKPADIIGKDDYQMVWQQMAELYRSDDRSVIESGCSKLNIEEPQITPEGNTITILTNKIPLRNKTNEVEGVLGIYLDITQRKLTENALRENEERLRLALKATNDVVWDWDIENDLQRWNEAGIKVFGWKEIVENSVNADWWIERVYQEDRQRVKEGLYQVVNDNSGDVWHDEYRFRKIDGTYAEVLDRGFVLRNDQGKAIRMIGAMLDITERKNAIKKLEESEFFANTIANSTPALLYLYDFLSGKNIWTNDVHKQFFKDINKNTEILRHEDIVQLIHPDDINASVISLQEFEKNRTIPHFDVELRIKHKGGWKWMRHLVTVFKRDDQERPVQILGALFDIDALKKTTEELHWRNVDLQLINAINDAANSNKSLASIIDLIAKQLKVTFNSHLLSVFKPDEKRREMRMYENKLDNELVKKIEKVTGMTIPQIVLRMDVENLFTEMEQSRKGILSIGKKEVTNRLAGYLEGTPWPVMVQKMVKKLLPVICDIIEYQSSAAVPMISNAKIVGYLELGSRDILTESDLERIQSIANHLATVIVKIEAEGKLRESEDRMASAFKYASNGMAFVAPDGRWLKVNPAIPAMLGYTEAELLSKTFQDITHPEDLSNDLDYVRQMLEGTLSSYQIEKRYYHKNGNIIWVLLSVSLAHDREGKPLHFISQIQDITKRKQAEETIRESEKKFRTLYETMSQGVVYQDATGAIIHTNPAAERILGLNMEQLQGRRSTDPRWHTIHEDGSTFTADTHPAMIAIATGKENAEVMGVFP